MFIYACGVSRVHQEFELFEQILKIVLLLKKSVVDSCFRLQAKVTARKCCFSLALFFSSTFSSSSLLWRHAKVLVDLSAGVNPEKRGEGLYERKSL